MLVEGSLKKKNDSVSNHVKSNLLNGFHLFSYIYQFSYKLKFKITAFFFTHPVHDRPIIIFFPAGQSSLSLENIFNRIIPQMVHMVFLKQLTISGAYTVNGESFSNFNIFPLRMEMNGIGYIYLLII